VIRVDVPGWVACMNLAGGYVADDDGATADPGAVTDRDERADAGVDADADLVADGDFAADDGSWGELAVVADLTASWPMWQCCMTHVRAPTLVGRWRPASMLTNAAIVADG
jgi:hypothetical protein